MRLPVVDNDREVQLQRKLQLCAQHGLLCCLRGGVPVIVQTDLADGADFRLRCQRADLRQTAVRPTGGLLRMPADGGIDKIIRLRDGNGARGRRGTIATMSATPLSCTARSTSLRSALNFPLS